MTTKKYTGLYFKSNILIDENPFIFPRNKEGKSSEILSKAIESRNFVILIVMIVFICVKRLKTQFFPTPDSNDAEH